MREMQVFTPLEKMLERVSHFVRSSEVTRGLELGDKKGVNRMKWGVAWDEYSDRVESIYVRKVWVSPVRLMLE